MSLKSSWQPVWSLISRALFTYWADRCCRALQGLMGWFCSVFFCFFSMLVPPFNIQILPLVNPSPSIGDNLTVDCVVHPSGFYRNPIWRGPDGGQINTMTLGKEWALIQTKIKILLFCDSFWRKNISSRNLQNLRVHGRFCPWSSIKNPTAIWK